ncbi:MAG: amidohydrolase family protein [Deltaproteobacteria bacterium]|nr:amidohydrolase family protein [Deltaproteobacteria bacterium]
MAHDLVLKNALVVAPSGVFRGGVAIDGEEIVALGSSATLGRGHREIDLDGKILLPGLFDPHVHFGVGDRIGEESMVEDFLHSTRDCLVGGVTTIATTSLLGRRPLPELFAQAVDCGRGHSWCDFKVTSVVGTAEQARQIPVVASEGGVSFKFFTGYVGEQAAGFGMDPEGITPALFHDACEQLRRCGTPAFPKIHAEDPYVRGILVDRLRRSGRADRLVAWAESSPEWAESVQIYTYGQIAHQLGVPLYPVHISAAHTVDTVKRLKADGMNVVGETIACFLSTTAPEMDAKGMGGKAKIQPPIRFEKDRERLWRGIQEGTISVVGTDSLCYSAAFKTEADFWDCRVGINLQVADTLALLFDEGVNRGRIDLPTLARVLSENAAKLYGLFPRKGAIAVGADADLVVLDPEREATLGVSRLRSRADYSLWEGRRVRGIPVMTFLRGHLVMQDGEIVTDRPAGRFVPQVARPHGLA